jgi:hypothetical protein
MMRGASPRSVAELLGHQITQDDDALRATCRRPALSAEVGLLDPPALPKSNRKGQRSSKGD